MELCMFDLNVYGLQIYTFTMQQQAKAEAYSVED